MTASVATSACGTDDALPSQIGRWRLGSTLGTGGLGVVVHGHDPATATDAAVKLVSGARQPDGPARLRREGDLLGRFDSPFILRFLDSGQEADWHFLTVELVSGALTTRLSDGVARDPWTTANIVDQVAKAVAVVHDRGIVHCDVHPGNLLITGDGGDGAPVSLLAGNERLVLGDFDIAVVVAEGRSVMEPFGTPRFRAPEQLDPEGAITFATDMYALGALTWALVAGTAPPFPDELSVATAAIPSRWADVIRRGMATDPADRFADPAEWRTVVRDALDSDLAEAGHEPLP